ncbi:MAG: VOC family protein [Gammaproteobacteria bacterium]|nr:VOC family protein [Gammaproteobacteria bacterium]
MDSSDLESPIWPAQLDHLRLDSDRPEALSRFYADALGLDVLPLDDGSRLLQGPGRRLVIGAGQANARPYHAWRVQSREQLEAIREFLSARRLRLETAPRTLFADGAVAVRDPDGWLNVFGLPDAAVPTPVARNASGARSLPARLQHVVVASDNLPEMVEFYERRLGFVPSDYVSVNPDDPATRKVAFYRTDPEHHSFAVFAASSVRPDHHAYETSCWNDIRDWADHLANLDIPIWWGPGRHGAGNNLFFMIKDPHGHPIEFSAELEVLPRYLPPRRWASDGRAVNLWGSAWDRD